MNGQIKMNVINKVQENLAAGSAVIYNGRRINLDAFQIFRRDLFRVLDWKKNVACRKLISWSFIFERKNNGEALSIQRKKVRLQIQ